MADGVPTEARPKGQTTTRRGFFQKTGELAKAAAAMAALESISPITSVLANPLHLEAKGASTPNVGEFDDEFNQLVAEAPFDRLSTEMLKRATVGMIDVLKTAYIPRIQKTERLIDLSRQNPVLMQEVGMLFGNAERTPEDVESILPPFEERAQMRNDINDIKDMLRNLKNDRSVDMETQYNDLILKVVGCLMGHLMMFPIEENSKPRSGATVEMGGGIMVTDEGKKAFAEDVEMVWRVMGTYPKGFFDALSTKFVLYSTRYGKIDAQQTRGTGEYFPRRDRVQGKTLANISIDMDHLGGLYPDLVLPHEITHAMDPSLNTTLAEILTDKEYIERLTHVFQIMNNPDWAGHDGSVQQLFRRTPNLREDRAFVDSGCRVTTNQFVAASTEYPRNDLIHSARLVSGYLKVLKFLPGLFEKVMGVKFRQLSVPLPRAEPFYPDLDSFLEAYEPRLQEWSKNGGLEAKIILSGLRRFKESFKNRNFLWQRYSENGAVVPSQSGAVESVWVNYLNDIVLNATLYHGAINNDPEFKEWVPDPRRRRECILEAVRLRLHARQEAFAEGGGWSHKFGSRLLEKPPFRVYEEEMANTLLSHTQEEANPNNASVTVSNPS